MKGEEKQRKFHETLLKMLYPPLSGNEEEEKEDDEAETILIEALNFPPEEEIENEAPSPSSIDDDGGAGKLTRAQRKRLRKRKLKEAATRRRKIIGPLLPGSDEDVDHSRGSIGDTSNVAEGARRNAATTNVSSDLSHSSSVEVVRKDAATNVAGEEASCSNKNKLKLKHRRKAKKMVAANSTPSSTDHHR